MRQTGNIIVIQKAYENSQCSERNKEMPKIESENQFLTSINAIPRYSYVKITHLLS